MSDWLSACCNPCGKRQRDYKEIDDTQEHNELEGVQTSLQNSSGWVKEVDLRIIPPLILVCVAAGWGGADAHALLTACQNETFTNCSTGLDFSKLICSFSSLKDTGTAVGGGLVFLAVLWVVGCVLGEVVNNCMNKGNDA